MKSEPYTGTVAAMKNSPWLASEDLLGLPSPELTIEEVIRNTDVTMDAGRVEPVLYSLKFAGAEKQMILNATNRKALTQAFGASTKKWRGQVVTVYVQEGVKMAGKIVSGLRLKPHKPDSAPFKTPTARKEPKRTEPPPLVLEQTEERPVETLRRRIAQDKLDLGRVQEWLDSAGLPAVEAMVDPEAKNVLDEYELLKEATR